MKKFLLVNKIYFFSLSILSFSLLIFNFNKNNLSIDSEIGLITLFLIFVIFLFNYVFIIKETISEYPINIFFNLYILINILVFTYNFNYIYDNTYFNIFYHEQNEPYIDFYIFLELYKKAIVIVLLTVIFLNFGFILTKKLIKNKIFNFFPELKEQDFLRLIFFLLIIKLISIFIFLFFNIIVPELINPINLLIVGISFYSLIHFEKNKLINIFIILFIFFENIFLTYAIYKNIILLVICFIIIYNYKKKISLIIFCLILVWVFLGQTFKVNFRQNQVNNATVQEQNLNNNTEVEVQELNLKIPEFNPRPVVLRLTEPVVSLIRIKDLERIKKKIVKKDTISIMAYSLIPRLFYKDKPEQDFAVWYTDYFFNVYQLNENAKKTVTYNIFWPSDFYLNFNYYGSIILSFIFGFILSLISKILTNFQSSKLHFLFGLSIISGLTFPDYNISLMLSPVLLKTIILFILLKILILLIKR